MRSLRVKRKVKGITTVELGDSDKIPGKKSSVRLACDAWVFFSLPLASVPLGLFGHSVLPTAILDSLARTFILYF